MTNSSSRDAEKSPDLDMLKNDLAALKRDFTDLAKHIKTGASDGVADTVRRTGKQFTDQAERLYGDIADKSEQATKALSQQVENQPLLSLLAAFGVGFVVSRLLSR
jgi:ElaB/YqjD/DUF883 family membrane-anchored ribosome-binding protein